MDTFPASPGLYLHIPFCASICPFCPYNKVIYERELAAAYFDALRRELAMYTVRNETKFTSLYIGGGTPSLCIDAIASVIADIQVQGERAIEVMPGHATTANLDRLAEAGINYISLGVQSFDQRVLEHLRRPNTVAQNRAALAATAGRFDCVDVDLIFDVAVESEEIFLADLETCFRAGVDQVSTYPLMRFGYTPFGKARHRSRDERRVLRAAGDMASAHGYERRSVWTFARQGSANFTSITREFYLGCGAGSGSYTGRLFFLNHFGVADYVARLRVDELPIARETEMSPMRAAAFYLFWQSYTGRIDIARFGRLFPGRRLLNMLLRAMAATGWMRLSGDDLRLTRSGYDRYHDLERWVTYHFIEPLWADMMREHAHLKDTLPDRSWSDCFWLQMSGLQS